jgi:transcriptional regulator with XRE-family HTH domain
MKNIDQIIAGLPPARRAKIEGRARELIGEEMALQQVRKALKLTQEQIGRALKMRQDSVSRLENRSDLLISTLRSYIKAMGGDLKIIAQFKEGTTVLSGLGTLDDDPPKATKAPAPRPAIRKKRHLELAHTE